MYVAFAQGLPGAVPRSIGLRMTKHVRFEHIVIGAGPGGCAVAAKRSDSPGVPLLEGGGTNFLPEVNDPVRWPTLLSGPLDWDDMSAPIRSCLDRVFGNNSTTMEGVRLVNVTIKDGKRGSVVHAYLQPAGDRTNLTVVTNAITHTLVMEGTRCVGVECSIDDRVLAAPNNRRAERTTWGRTDSTLTAPNNQRVIPEFPVATRDTAGLLPNQNCCAIAPSIIHPESRGRVMISSADPTVAPLIDLNDDASDNDVSEMLVAIDLGREMGASPAFNELRKREVIPGTLARTAMMGTLKDSRHEVFSSHQHMQDWARGHACGGRDAQRPFGTSAQVSPLG